MTSIRKPAVAGMFYPSDKKELVGLIDKLLDENKVEREHNSIAGIVAPHAGYIYSGRSAAFAYNTLRNKNYRRVIVISPSHREYFSGISIYPGEAYSTPFGDIKIDSGFRDALVTDNQFIRAVTNGHGKEHALEVQLPFLQRVLGEFELVPIVIGDQNQGFVFSLAESISRYADEETLIVASSDLSHFHTRAKASALDGEVLNAVGEFNYQKLQHLLDANNCEACGGGCIVAMMKAAELMDYKQSEILSYTDSGDVTGDTSEVVGYFSAVVYR